MVFNLTVVGSFKCEIEVDEIALEDIVHSINELEMMLNLDETSETIYH